MRFKYPRLTYAQQMEQVYDQMIPHRRFAWLPIRTSSNNWIWLGFVWRFAYLYTSSSISPIYKYCDTLEEAVINSMDRNRYISGTANYDAIQKRIATMNGLLQ